MLCVCVLQIIPTNLSSAKMENRVNQIKRSASAGLSYKQQMQQIRAARDRDYADFKRKAASEGDKTDGNETDPISDDDDDNNNNNKRARRFRFLPIDVDSDATDPQHESDDDEVQIIEVTDDVRTASRALQQAVDMAAAAATAAAVATATATADVDVNVVAADADADKYRYCEYHGTHDVCHAVDFTDGDDSSDNDEEEFDRNDPRYRSDHMSPEDVRSIEEANDDENDDIAARMAECAKNNAAMQKELIGVTRCSKRAAIFFCMCVESRMTVLLPVAARPLAREVVAHIYIYQERDRKHEAEDETDDDNDNNNNNVNNVVPQAEIDYINANLKGHRIFRRFDHLLHVNIKNVPYHDFQKSMCQGIDILVDTGLTRQTAVLVAESIYSNNRQTLPPPLVKVVWTPVLAARRKYLRTLKSKNTLAEVARTVATPPAAPHDPHDPRFAGDDANESDYDDDLIDPRQ